MKRFLHRSGRHPGFCSDGSSMRTFAVSTELLQLVIKKIIPSNPPDSIFGNSFTILSKMLFCLMGEGGGASPGADARYGKSLSIFQMMHKLYSIMLYHMKLKVLFKQCCTAVGHSALSD